MRLKLFKNFAHHFVNCVVVVRLGMRFNRFVRRRRRRWHQERNSSQGLAIRWRQSGNALAEFLYFCRLRSWLEYVRLQVFEQGIGLPILLFHGSGKNMLRRFSSGQIGRGLAVLFINQQWFRWWMACGVVILRIGASGCWNEMLGLFFRALWLGSSRGFFDAMRCLVRLLGSEVIGRFRRFWRCSEKSVFQLRLLAEFKIVFLL